MMFKRKLWRRILPAILSIAMVLETVPANALAAEYEESEVVEKTAFEGDEAEIGNDDAQNEKNDAQDQEDDGQNETGNVSEDSNTTADENITAKEPSEEPSGDKTQTADTDTNDNNVENAVENIENIAAALDTKIVVDEKALGNYCNNSSSYQYDVDKKIILVKYDENNSNPFESLLTRIKSNYIRIEVDGRTNSSLAESLKYQWQKADGSELAVNSVPVEAGEYMLVITLDAVENTCSKAEAKIPFTITKRQLSVELSDAYEVVPGTTVGAFKTDFQYYLNREGLSWNSEATEDITDAKASYIDTVSLAVYNAYQTQTPLADDVKFLEGTDYVVSVKPILKQTVSSNYAISQETILKIKSYGRIETWIEAAPKKPEEPITKIYSDTNQKQISYATEIKDKLTVTVNVYDDKSDKNVILDNAVVTEVWFDGAKQELGEGAEFEPQMAGTYYLGFRYYPTEEDANIYKACKDSDLIRVVIERAPLTVVPSFKENAEVFYTGMTEANVLKYADYKLLDANKAEVKIDRDTFWGVSYDDIDEYNTDTMQSYEPVFQLIRAEKDASGNPIKDETTGKEIWTENGSQLLNAAKYCYRLVFTGKKTVYTKAGDEASNKRVDVNGSDVDAEDKNHSIITTADALSANYADVPVVEAKKTKIDVSGILQQNFNTLNLNDLYQPAKLVSKVYDGKELYEPSRAEYKKAVVTSTDDNQEVAKNYDSAITYKWYKINSVKAVYDETDPENPKQTGWEVDTKSQVGGTSNNIPTAAGEYMLEIRFAKTGYVSCSETIYYRIDKQMLVVDIQEIPTAFKNESVESYTSAVHYDGTYNVYVVPDNQYSESVKTEGNLLKDWYKISFYDELSDYPYSGYYYKLNWYVEQVSFDENNNPVKDESGNIVYTKLNNYDNLSITGANTYRLGVTLTSGNSNYTNYEVIYDAEKSMTPMYTTKYHNDFANITVSEKEAGTTSVTIELDTEKFATTKDYDGKPFYASANEAWAAIKSALTLKNAQTGEEIAQENWPQLIYDITDLETDDSIDFEEMVYGGSYNLSLYILSDATYQFSYLEDAAEYTINRIPLTITPALTEDIPAGTYAGYSNDGIIYSLEKTKFAGYVEADAAAFQYGTPVYIDDTKTLGFGAFAYVEDGQHYYNTLSAIVSKAGDASRYYGYIKYGKEYAVQLTGTLAYPHNRNYDATYVRTIFGATHRGNSTAGSEDFEGVAETAFARRVDGTAVIITPTSVIPYMRNVDTTDRYDNPISGEGNYFAFRINAPYEFYEDNGRCLEKYYKNFIYRSSIETAGGFVLEAEDNYIKVVFPVKEKTPKSFDIIWENGYTEKYTVDFTNAVLEDDLTKAVAPKSLSFNGVSTKMVVGGEQQLDVKIKKAQINDIIYIDYQVTQGEDVISVMTDDKAGVAGCATALKPGKATIAAVPVKIVNGVKTKIDGAKAATITITVSDVTAPAIKKVAATDKNVTFTYVKPTDGYRREVYVLEGKKKAEDFESLIRSTNNGQWSGIFAVQPQYYTNESVDAKTKTTQRTISGLSGNGEYTLYVRNVSAIRTLGDGSCVQLSAKGTVKTFKTTKPQVEALGLYARTDANLLVSAKTVNLADKTEQLYTEGRFSTIHIDAAADAADKSWLALPLDKAYGKAFVAPKLVYAVSSEPDGLDEVDVSDIRDFRNYTYIGGRYYKKTDIATVDKNGKVTFKGVGKVYVIVYDQTRPQIKDYVTLNIRATADSIKAKDGKLAVGKGLYLSSLLTYYEGKTALAGMDYQNTGIIGTTYKPNLTVSAEEVTKINNEGNFYLRYTGDGDYYIYAKKPNAACSIALNDGTLSASLKIQSTPIESVKDLKITDVADDRFTIGFSYPVETYLNGVKYRIDITDARGSLVDSLRYDAGDYTSYDGKKKTFTQVVEYQNDKIARLSKYSVSVTTLCADEASAKPVTKAVKTTDFPAAYNSVIYYGGIGVYVYSTAGTNSSNAVLRDRRYLTSGNTYTLRAEVSNLAIYRMTDTLTWKSSDTKVATVKAKAGTYTAQLNALKPGITEIEVTSKITKKVIARYPVFVKAVGNAATYYGDYEYTGEYTYTSDPYYTSGMEVLTLQNPVRVTSSELNNNAEYHYKWVKFTAPAYGRYQFHCEGNLVTALSSSEERAISVNAVIRRDRFAMLEGETFYFKVQGAFTMEISDYTKQGVSFTVDDGSVLIDSDAKQLVAFRATEDNVYTFYSKELPNLPSLMSMYDENNNSYSSFGGDKYNTWTDDDGIRRRDISLGTGEIVYLEVPAGKYTIYAEKRNPAELSDDGTILELTDKVKEKWYVYTASQDGLYTFRSKEATAAFTAAYYKNLKDLNSAAWSVANDGGNFTGKMTLKAGQKVLLKVSADEAATAAISVTPEIPVKLLVGEEKELPVKTDDRRWIAFTLPEAGRYQFRAVPTESGADYHVNVRYYKNAIEENKFTPIDENEIIVSDVTYYNPDAAVGDTIYVEVTTDKESGDAANVKVSLTQVQAVELKIGEPVSITVKNGDVQWFTYTVPKDIRYVVQSVVTENVGADNAVTDTHKLTADLYMNGLEQRNKTNTLDTIGAYDFTEEIKYSKEMSETIRVSANDLGLGEDGGEITTTAVIVLKEAVVPIEMEDPQTLTLRTGERRWFSFTAPQTDTYIFRSDLTEGKFDLSYKTSMESNTWYTLDNVRAAHDLEKDETIYLQLKSTSTPAKLTFSVGFPDKLSGTAEKTVTVTSKTPVYFMYVTGSDELARYVATYTKDVQDAEVSLYYDNTRANPMNNSVKQGYVERDMEDRCFFKVSTTSETPVAVTVKIAQIEPIKLNVGDTDNIPVAAEGESGVRRNTWCSFTAPETGRYAIDKTTSDFSTLLYYKKMTGSPNPVWQNYYYEKGETIYIALYTTSENEQSTSVKINKIETTQIENTSASVDEQILTSGILNTKGYLYTAQKTGLYTFTNESLRVSIKLHMDPSDNNGESVSSSKSLFLKENDTIYINALPTEDIATVKFTIVPTEESQGIFAGENTITLGEQNSKLTAFTAPDTGLYDFAIAYTGESSIGSTGTAYLMMNSQAIGTNSALYSSMSGSAGSIALPNRLITQGETIYLSIPKPSSATGATITVSKAEETIDTETVTEGVELERVFEDGDKVYYIFDVPEDGNYQVMAESRVDTGYCYYNIYCNEYGLSDSEGARYWMNVGTSGERLLSNLKKHQRICFRVDKSAQSGDSVSKFSMTIKKQS